jgi:threonine dehydratase
MSQNSADRVDQWRDSILSAKSRIYDPVLKTPMETVDEPDAHVYFKMEYLQRTGSFKLRGATNKIFSLDDAQKRAGVVTSSTGNHGLGVATAAKYKGVDAEVFVSSAVDAIKFARLEENGARIHLYGTTPLAAEMEARRQAEQSGRVYVSPYNDPLVVAGQGTIAVELLEDLPSLDAVFVAVGGGGLIGGIGAYLHAVSPRTEVVGCWPSNSRVLYESLLRGEIIDFPEEPTLSESTAGGVEPGSITFELCQEVINRKVLVQEEEILKWLRWSHDRGWKVEGAGAVAIAGFMKVREEYRYKDAAVVLCGGNLSPKVASLLA